VSVALNVLLLLAGIVFIVRGLQRSPLKNYELYFGLYAVIDGGGDLIPGKSEMLENVLGALSAISILAAAVLVVAFVNKPAPKPAE
jgi:hypothetical protein